MRVRRWRTALVAGLSWMVKESDDGGSGEVSRAMFTHGAAVLVGSAFTALAHCSDHGCRNWAKAVVSGDRGHAAVGANTSADVHPIGIVVCGGIDRVPVVD